MIARAIIGRVAEDAELSLETSLIVELDDGTPVVPWPRPQPVDPATAVLVERVVAAYRGLNERLGWVENPASLDAFIRELVRFHFAHNVRQRPEAWDGSGLDVMADALQAELMEELTEPWPLRALDHPPGQRTPPHPEVVIDGGTARIAFGPFVTDPIALPR